VIPWLSVIGIGEDGLSGLTPAARALLESAEVLIGAERHLAMIPVETDRARCPERHAWPSPMTTLLARIPEQRGRRVCVLATGDPLHFGVGAALSRLVDPAEMTVLPGRSAFQLAAARLVWPLENCALLTVHGRALESLNLHIAPGLRLIILTQDAATPAAIAQLLTERGFGRSRITVFDHMDGPRERRGDGLAQDWRMAATDFNTVAVECVAGPEALWHPRTGLPDDAFQHDGKLTNAKSAPWLWPSSRRVRAPCSGDIGAGCGSIGVEWLRAEAHTRAIALEPSAERRALAARNAAALGVPNLDLRDARAPEALADLAAPDAVFVGGGICEATIQASMQALAPGGRLVAHAVTLESEAVLLAAYASHAGELVRLSVARAEPVGPFSGWRPAMPVTQWAWRKPGHTE
jgi:precorrin-6Y C5,15-methyltransferase (decarboxylating)